VTLFFVAEALEIGGTGAFAISAWPLVGGAGADGLASSDLAVVRLGLSTFFTVSMAASSNGLRVRLFAAFFGASGDGDSIGRRGEVAALNGVFETLANAVEGVADRFVAGGHRDNLAAAFTAGGLPDGERARPLTGDAHANGHIAGRLHVAGFHGQSGAVKRIDGRQRHQDTRGGIGELGRLPQPEAQTDTDRRQCQPKTNQRRTEASGLLQMKMT